MSRRHRGSPPFSLFSFQDIITAVTGIMILSPILGNPGVPPPIKIFLSLMLAVIFFPLVDRSDVALGPGWAAMAWAAISELSVGLLIGFAASMIFAGVQPFFPVAVAIALRSTLSIFRSVGRIVD